MKHSQVIATVLLSGTALALAAPVLVTRASNDALLEPRGKFKSLSELLAMPQDSSAVDAAKTFESSELFREPLKTSVPSNPKMQSTNEQPAPVSADEPASSDWSWLAPPQFKTRNGQPLEESVDEDMTAGQRAMLRKYYNKAILVKARFTKEQVLAALPLRKRGKKQLSDLPRDVYNRERMRVLRPEASTQEAAGALTTAPPAPKKRKMQPLSSTDETPYHGSTTPHQLSSPFREKLPIRRPAQGSREGEASDNSPLPIASWP